MIVSSTDVCLRRGAKNYNALAFLSRMRGASKPHTLTSMGCEPRQGGIGRASRSIPARFANGPMLRSSGGACGTWPHSCHHSPSFMSSFAIIRVTIRHHSCHHSPSFMSSFAIIHVIIPHHSCHHSPSFMSSFALIMFGPLPREHGLRTSARRPQTSEPLNTRASRE